MPMAATAAAMSASAAPSMTSELVTALASIRILPVVTES
jgi:hypothetical protein